MIMIKAILCTPKYYVATIHKLFSILHNEFGNQFSMSRAQ
jgi:hypothetical protein